MKIDRRTLKRVGTFGEVIIEAHKRRMILSSQSVREPKPQSEEPQTMNVVTPTKLFERQPNPTGGRMPKTSRKHLTHEQLAEIMKLLTKHGDVVNGTFVYAQGWSDERIAELVKPATGIAGIVKVRRKHFASMANEIQQKPRTSPNKTRLAQLELAFGEIKADVAEVAKRVTALEDAVTKG